MADTQTTELDSPISRHLRTDFTTIRADHTVDQALQSLRSTRLGEKIVYFYAIDLDSRLVGVVPTRRLLMSPPDARIDSIMVRNVISIPLDSTVFDACELFVMHRLLALPVIDASGAIRGVVDVSLVTDEMSELTERETATDVFQLIGVRLKRGRRPSPLLAFRSRFPWLLCNIGGGLACAVIAGFYDHLMESAVILAMFIPVVLALAESVSMQSMTLTIQTFHEQSDWRTLLRDLRTEFLTALLLGLACGGTVGAVAFLWKHHAPASIAIGAAISLAMLTACLLGVLLPSTMRLLDRDPHIASGPIVLATADVLTLIFYFTLAGQLLR